MNISKINNITIKGFWNDNSPIVIDIVDNINNPELCISHCEHGKSITLNIPEFRGTIDISTNNKARGSLRRTVGWK